MNLFRKPYIAGIYGVRARPARHPYDRRLFREYPAFPLLVLDTGAFLFCHDHFGSADGDDLLRAVKDRSLFGPWTRDGKFDWDLQHKQSSRSSMRNLVEKQSWIHRLYFLLPVAQEFFRTGDEAWARLWYDYFDDWERKHPFREQHCVNFYKESDLVWFDMQVCWRTLNLIHSAYLLAGSRTFTRARWKRLYAAIEFGCVRLLTEAAKALAAGTGRGNHFLQKGTALLYAGICFPEFGRTAEFIETGKAVIRKMMMEEIDADGAGVEDSLSYGHFIARLYVDAYLLMRRNGVPRIEGLGECIRKQYSWLRRMVSPLRSTLLFNDAGAMDAEKDLEIVGRLLPLRADKPRKSVLLRKSQVGRIGNKRFDLYFDAMPHRDFWHDHHGRPNFVLYADGLPLIVDTGCPNYDHFLRENYMTRSWAHNVPHIHEKPEHNIGEGCRQPFPVVSVTGFRAGTNSACVSFVHQFRWDEHRLDYTWTRTLRLDSTSITVCDRIRSARAITATNRLHLAPLNLVLVRNGKRATAFFNGRDISIEQAAGTTAGAFELEYKPAYDHRNRLAYAPCLRSTARGTVLAWNVRIVL